MIGAASSASQAHAPADGRMIPFDYAFRFQLTGKPGNVQNNTVVISIESAFVAVSIGYGAIPRVTPVVFGVPEFKPVSGPIIELAADETSSTTRDDIFDLTLNEIADAARGALKETDRRLKTETVVDAVFRNGIKLNPRRADAALASFDGAGETSVDGKLFAQLFQVVSAPPDAIQFLYALFDEGSGREFQSEPILNTASLGISNGDRPFRYFPKPISFAPRSTIRLQITEVSDFEGELHVALQGYKVLGQAGTPTGRPMRMRRRR